MCSLIQRITAGLLLLAGLTASAAEEIAWDALVPPEARELQEIPLPLHDLADLGDLSDPLEVTAHGTVQEFLLVPYFGACIHVPPPPSNQIVHVRSRKGIQLEALYQPFWITGVMRVEHTESELANAGYRISDASTEPYDY